MRASTLAILWALLQAGTAGAFDCDLTLLEPPDRNRACLVPAGSGEVDPERGPIPMQWTDAPGILVTNIPTAPDGSCRWQDGWRMLCNEVRHGPLLNGERHNPSPHYAACRDGSADACVACLTWVGIDKRGKCRAATAVRIGRKMRAE